MQFRWPLPEELLTREQEHELAVIIKTKPDTEEANKAIDTLVRHNIKFAVAEANKIRPDDEDLQQEMVIALYEAAKRIDPSFTNKLASYATWHMKSRRNKYMSRFSRQVSLPTRHMEERRDMPKQIPLNCTTNHENDEPLGDRIDLASGCIDDGSGNTLLESVVSGNARLQYVDSSNEYLALVAKVNQLARQAMVDLKFGKRRVEVMNIYFNMAESGESLRGAHRKIGELVGLRRQRIEQIVNTSIPMIRKYLLRKYGQLISEVIDL